jgi:hypothetical protein
MASDHPIRASDRDRDTVVDTLRDAYTAGRLTLEEFNERTAAAYASRTWDDLRELTADLPVQPVLGADIPERDAPRVPALPSAPPLPAPPPHTPPRPAQRGHAGMLIPFVMFWFLVALVTHSPAAVAAPVVIIVVVLLISGIFRRR